MNEWICALSFRRNTVSDEADAMSSGRLFHSFGPAEANDRSPAVTRRDRRYSKLVASWRPKSTLRRHISNAAPGQISSNCSCLQHIPTTCCASLASSLIYILFTLSIHLQVYATAMGVDHGGRRGQVPQNLE